MPLANMGLANQTSTRGVATLDQHGLSNEPNNCQLNSETGSAAAVFGYPGTAQIAVSAGIHSCPSLCGSDGPLDFAAVTRRARMMGATRVPGVGVGVRVVHGAVTVSQCV
jgi:hypothetical protein